MLHELHEDDPKHFKHWLNCKKGLGNESYVGPGLTSFMAPQGAPTLLADLTLLRVKYGPTDLRPIEALDALKIFVGELVYIYDDGGYKSLGAYVYQHFFRFQFKLLVSESTFKESAPLGAHYFPLTGS